MRTTLGRALLFVLGSVISGLAIAFLVVAWRPELVRRATPVVADPAPSMPALAVSTAVPAPARVTYSDAVQRSAPAV